MIKGRATAEGTSRYARRHPELPLNYRSMLGVEVSSIGLGTYLGEHDDKTDRAYHQAVTAGLRGGINLLDSAVNYRLQRSERSIGSALAELLGKAELARDEVVIATKGGYITFDGEVPADPRGWLEEALFRRGLVQPGELVDGSHCMAPKYLEAMLALSRQNLGLETIDVYYVHNPESQLPEVGRAEFNKRIRKAFELLEQKAASGEIGVYGVATWNGFRQDAKSEDYLSMRELVELAREAAGGPRDHFKMIQLPFNLAMAEALTKANQQITGGWSTTLNAARELGIAVCASASLLQGRLIRGLPPMLGEALEGLDSDAQRAIQFVRSAPGVDVALVGMKNLAHVEHNLATARRSPAPLDSFLKLFEPPADSE